MSLLVILGRGLICLSVVLVVPFLLVSCFSDVRMGKALVWREGRDICFAPSVDGRELPSLHAVQVYDISESPDLLVWSFYFPKDEIHMMNESCLAYGVLPVGAKARGQAEKLVVGHAYGVYINAKYSDSYSPVFGFSRKFCLRDGRADVTLINHNEINGWNLSQCK